MRRIALLCLCITSAPAFAQVTNRDPSPGLDQGIVAEWTNGALTRSDDKVASFGDFSVFAQPVEHSPLAVRSANWELTLAENAVVFKMAAAEGKQIVMQTPPLQSAPRSIVASIKRDPRQALSGIWIDGVEMASVAIAPGQMIWVPSSLNTNATSLRIYDSALTRSEIIELAQASPNQPPAPFDGEFAVMDGDVISVLGGTEAVGLVESAWLEPALMIFAGGKAVSLRDLSWEADTVQRQDRPMNFGNLTQQLQRTGTGTTTVILMFGRQDCIEMGAGGASAFHDALEKIIQTCAAQTRRLVIIGPVPFEKKEPPLPNLSPKNAALRDYNEALLALAEKNRGLFVDVIAAWPKDVTHWTTDGLTMTGAGHRVLAQIIARQLWNGPPLDATAMPLRNTIIQKNQLWHDYWRPSNWAFLHGDRTAQPSSRDHLNPSVRWFPAELEKYRELIAAKERAIWKQAAERGGKLP